jgi:Uma2 family endonuclease
MITDINQLDFDKKYSYADYLTWKFDEYVELIKGKIMRMSAPSRNHQRIAGRLLYLLEVRLEDIFFNKNA